MSAVVVLSGGMDSTVLLDHLLSDMAVTSCVSFNYGQRHKKELEFAAATAEAHGITHHVIDLYKSGFTEALAPSGSSLVTDTDVPEGHYAEESMKATVVPNRNMVMLSIAGAIGVAEGAQVVATGVHAGDHFIYPDCRPPFISAASHALFYGNEGFGTMSGIIAPFIEWSKAQIAGCGIDLGVDFSKTWSCYKGGDIHCGKCGTCVERLEAIAQAAEFRNMEREDVDTTEYEDVDFWKRAIEEAKN